MPKSQTPTAPAGTTLSLWKRFYHFFFFIKGMRTPKQKKHEECNTNDHLWNLEEPQPIAVPLLGDHAKKSGNPDYQLDYQFVGREHLIKELITILKETRNTQGCYLISGFRGSGKTRLINKVLYFYKSGKSGPVWLPTVVQGYELNSLKSTLDRGQKKLNSYSSPSKNYLSNRTDLHKTENINLLNRMKKYFSAKVIVVKVNLSQDGDLTPREVLFNTATLLYCKLRNKKKYTELIQSVTIAVIVVVLAIAGLGTGLSGWLSNLPSPPDLPVWLVWLRPPNPIGGLLFFISIASVIYYFSSHIIPTNTRILHLLRRLNKRMAYAIENNRIIQSQGLSFSRKESMPPLDARQIENELLYILKECRRVPRFLGRPDIIFVFDELDKIAYRRENDDGQTTNQPSVGRDLHGRKKKVDDLLGGLKNFITHGRARFFFIAGREMLDSYQAERGSTSSLYESLFNRVFEVPSLLTDSSDHNQQRIHSLMEVYVCRKIMDPDVAIYLWLQYTNRHQKDDPCWEKDLHRKLMYSPFCLRTYYHFLHFVDIDGEEARRIVLGLRNFIQFLTLHSWGNPKRLESLFAHFTKPSESVDWRQNENVQKINGANKDVQLSLQFGLIDQQRIVLASNLYTQLYHDLGRQLASSGDKLAVSTMAAFQYILKFHRHPFCRYHFERMSETLSIYRSPELNTMIDTLISKVFHPHIRRIRNSQYRYRFSGDFERELRYISRVSDIESAAFNFSLDASAPIKSHYIDQLKTLKENESSNGESVIATYELCMIIGDLFALEQSRDEAFTYYQKAVNILDKCDDEKLFRFAHFRVEALLRLGEIYEDRQRYDQAASIYLHARSIVNKLATDLGREQRDALQNGDSKWDIFRQPFWAYWFLQLKRSPVTFPTTLLSLFEYPLGNARDRVNFYRAGQLAFFYGCHHAAMVSFVEAIRLSGFVDVNSECSERSTYLGAYACLHLGENIFAGMMQYMKEGFDVPKLLEWIKSCGKSPLEDKSLPHQYLEAVNQYLAELEGVADLTKKDEFIKRLDAHKTLCLMCYAADQLSKRGLHYHASIAYLKVLSIWGMLSDILFLLEEFDVNPVSKKGEPPMQNSSCATLFIESEKWISKIRKLAAESITYMSAGGYSRFQARWKNRDVAWLFKESYPDTGGPSPLSIELSNKWDHDDSLFTKSKDNILKNNMNFEFGDENIIGFELESTLDALFPIEGATSPTYSSKKKIARVLRVLKESIFLQRSLTGQKLIYLSIWEYMAKIRFRSDHKLLAIPHQRMVPHSTRSLMFAHWLSGRRYLHWEVLDELAKLKGNDITERIYNSAAKAVHNLHRAIYYIRQLSGNDQDLMFPDPSMVLYDLWRLLYALVEHVVKKEGKGFDEAIRFVKKELSTSNLRRHDSTPANFYDFNNVRRRTIDALRDVEQLGDISNRVRSDAIRTRHFLADDYEDPRFHLDWTMAQMYGPAAGILRQRVELATKELRSPSR